MSVRIANDILFMTHSQPHIALALRSLPRA